ncbi:MAG: hypothetical protein ACI9HK_002981 [Pirellulaceae bacterium]|jgi:hypothetical protein
MFFSINNMFFWTREIAGWLMVGGGLWLVSTALQYVESRQVIEASVVGFICALLIRCGVALIRVSTAARICGVTSRREQDKT